MAVSALLENAVSFEKWIVVSKEIKKHFIQKKLFPAIKRSNL